MPVDELDRKILKELLEDSRRSYREVARRLKVATGTIVKRVKRMEDEGVIRNYSITVDHEKLGYDLTAITEITVSKGRLLEMEKEIAKIPLTCAVYDVTGLTDAMIIAKFRGRDELSKFAKNLLSLPFVERTNTRVVLTTVKEDFRLH
ncbi:MAG: Lrp/AsnC family transcriptional regulator [Thaumarchaeota archaeon]|nr:Lrp/AsnC family transcriptional regulator [Nitrososphaerota archaeon]